MENNILKIIDESQDLIRNVDGLTGSDAFEEVIKVFFTLNFKNENIKTSEELRKIFEEEVSSEYDFFLGNTIKLKDLTLVELMRLFSKVDLKSEDVKGRIFEGFLGRVFTSGLGQFFTPREIVDFMTDFLKKNNLIREDSVILDPACGSSGILLKTQTGTQTIIGFDINERLTRVSKMNMVIHKIKNFKIYNQSFLNDVKLPQVDLVCTNPPFGVEEKQKEVLDKFKFGVSKTKRDLEILFIEKIIKVLKPGGICAIVLPDGFFNNVSLIDERKYLLDNCDLIASVDLPENVFKSTGTGCETGILFFRKKNKSKTDEISFKAYKVDYVGYETQTKFAKKIIKNDLNDILNNQNYLNQIEVNEINKSFRIDAKYYIRKNKISNLPKMDLFEKSGKNINKVYKNEDTIRYVQYSDIDPVFGIIKSYTTIEKIDAPNRAKIVVKKNDILIPKLKQSLDKVALVTEEFEGCVVTNGFYVIKPKDSVSANYLFGLFRKKQIQDQLKDFSSGTIMPSVDDEYFDEIHYLTENDDEEIIIDKKIKEVLELINNAKIIMNNISEN
jgi:type I restriction enzyme M protein